MTCCGTEDFRIMEFFYEDGGHYSKVVCNKCFKDMGITFQDDEIGVADYVLTFGKYKGKRLRDINDRNYISWAKGSLKDGEAKEKIKKFSEPYKITFDVWGCK